jgi:hypothetical protein
MIKDRPNPVKQYLGKRMRTINAGLLGEMAQTLQLI